MQSSDSPTSLTGVSRRSFLRTGLYAGAGFAGAALLAACGSGTKKSANGPKYQWRTGTVVAPTDPFVGFLNDVAAAMKEKTNGAVEMTVFPSGQLGAERQTPSSCNRAAPSHSRPPRR